MLDVAEKRLKEVVADRGTLKKRVRSLESEKAELLSAATGVTTDIILDYEHARSDLDDARQRIDELEKCLEDKKKAADVYEYKEKVNRDTEESYRREIEKLRCCLDSSHVGRTAESEIFLEKSDALKKAEEEIQELERENGRLCEQIVKLSELVSLTEVHGDAGLILSLKKQLQESCAREKRIMANSHALEKDLAMVQAQLTEYTQMKSATQEERAAKGAIMDMLKGQVKDIKSKIQKNNHVSESETESETDDDSHPAHKHKLQKRLSTVTEISSTEDETELPEAPVRVLVTQPTVDTRSETASVASDSMRDVDEIQEEIASEGGGDENPREGEVNADEPNVGEEEKEVPQISEQMPAQDVQSLQQQINVLSKEVINLRKLEERLRSEKADLAEAKNSVREENISLTEKLSEYERTIADLEEQLSVASTDVTEQTDCIERLKLNLQDLDTENALLTKKNETFTLDIEKLMRELKVMETDRDGLKQELVDMETKFDGAMMANSAEKEENVTLKAQIEALTKEIEAMKSTADEMEEQMTALESNLTEMESKYGAILTENESLKRDLGAMRDVNGQITEDLDSAERMNRDLQEELSAIRSAVDEMKAQCEEAEEANQELREKLGSLEEYKIQASEDAIVKQSSTSKMQTQVDALLSKNKELSDQIEGLQKDEVELRGRLADLDDSKVSVEAELDAAKRNTVEMDAQIVALVISKEKMKGDLAESEKKVKNVAEKLDEITQNRDELSAQVAVMEGDQEKLKEDLESAQKKLTEKEAEVEKEREVGLKRVLEMEGVAQHLEETLKERDDAKIAVDGLEKTKIALEESLVGLKNEVAEFEEKLKRIEEELAASRQEVMETKEKLEQRDEEVSHLKEELEVKERIIAETEAEVKELEERVKDAEQQNSREEEKMSVIIREHEAFAIDLRSKVTEYESITDELRLSLEKLEALRLEESAHHKEEMVEKEDNWGEIASQFEEKMEKNEAEFKEKEQELMAKISALEAKVAELDGDRAIKIEGLMKQVEELEANASVLNETIDDLKEIERQLQLQVQKSGQEKEEREESEKRIAGLEESKTGVEEELKVVKTEVEVLRQSEEQLRMKLEAVENQKSEFEIEAQGLESLSEVHNEKMDAVISGLEQTVQQLKKELDEIKEKMAEESKKLREEIIAKETEIAEMKKELDEKEERKKIVENAEVQEKELKSLAEEKKKILEDLGVKEEATVQMRKELDELRGNLADERQKVAEITEQKDEVTKLVDEKNSSMNEMETELIRLKSDLNEVQQERSKQTEGIESQFNDLRGGLSHLQEENSELREVLAKKKEQEKERMKEEKLGAESVRAMEERIREMEKGEIMLKMMSNEMKDLQQRIIELESAESTLKEDLLKKQQEEQVLNKRVMDLERDLEESVARNIDLDVLESEVVKARIQELEDVVKTQEENKDELLQRIELLEERLKTSERQRSVARERLEVYQESEGEDLHRLQEKMDLLLDSEEKMIDRIAEADKIRSKLERQIDLYEQDVVQLEAENEALQKRAVSLEDELVKKQEATNRDALDEAEGKVLDLEDTLRNTKNQITSLEKNNVVLRSKLQNIEINLKQKDSSEKDLRALLTDHQEAEDALKTRIMEMEKTNSLLQTRITDIEKHNQGLLKSVKTATSDQAPRVHLNSSDELVEEFIFPENRAMHMKAVISDADELKVLNKEDLVKRIQDLEQLEKFQYRKIHELTENLNHLRMEVETVATVVHTENKLLADKSRTKDKEMSFEARIQELARSETASKLKMIDLQKREISLKDELREAAIAFRERETEHRKEVDSLENELNDLRKAHARLKNKIQYGTPDQQSQSLAKIQHLESLVFDSEASERKLQRQVAELQEVEAELRDELRHSDSNGIKRVNGWKNVVDREKHIELLQQIHLLKNSEEELKLKLSDLEKHPVNDLYARISTLERSERGLKRQVEFFENNKDVGGYNPSMLDTPEDILKQRIHDLERLEQHLKLQISELERDREDLHSIARNDKNTIHDLNVKVRELQMADKNHKEQISRMDMAERKLQMEIDDLNDQVDDLDSSLRKMKKSERLLKSHLNKSSSNETDLNSQLENTIDDRQSSDIRLRRRIHELEREKDDLIDKLHDLTDRIGDLEASELTMKYKLRQADTTSNHNDLILQNQVTELEMINFEAKNRIAELEDGNGRLNKRIQRLEEEKANLNYDVSEAEMKRDEAVREKERLELNNEMLEDRLEQHEDSDAQERIDRAYAREMELQEQVQTAQDTEFQMKKTIRKLEKEVEDLRTKDEEINELKRKVNNLSTIEQEKAGIMRALTSTRKTNELLRSSYESVKEDLNKLKLTAKKTNKEKRDLPSKGVQVKLADSITLKQLTPDDFVYLMEFHSEFRSAIRQLGAQHPRAYQDFVQHLLPSNPALSRVQVKPEEDSVTTPEAERHSLVGRSLHNLVDSGRDALIGQFADNLPLTPLRATQQQREGEYWRTVENPCFSEAHDEAYWADVERSMGSNVDDVTLMFDLRSVTSEESEAGSSNTGFVMATKRGLAYPAFSSVDALTPPLPPSSTRRSVSPSAADSSYYLPSSEAGDHSADEADDIVDEEAPVHRAKSLDRELPAPVTHDRARSEDREIEALRPMSARKKGVASLESIADSGMESLREDDIHVMRRRIALLERQAKDLNSERSLNANQKQIILHKEMKIKELERELAALSRTELPNTPNSLLYTDQSTQSTENMLEEQRQSQLKNHEIERLNRELNNWKETSRVSQLTAEELQHDLKRSEQQMNEIHKKYSEIGSQHAALQAEHAKCPITPSGVVVKDEDEKSALQKVIQDLRFQLEELGRQSMLNTDNATLHSLQQELTMKMDQHKQLQSEKESLNQQIDELRSEVAHFKPMQENYNRIRSQYKQMEALKSKAQEMLSPLRAKVIRLANLCKEKDTLISKLVSELSQLSTESSSVLTEANRVVTQGASAEYQRPISPKTSSAIEAFEFSPDVPVPSPRRRRSSKIPRRFSPSFDSSYEGSSNGVLDRDVSLSSATLPGATKARALMPYSNSMDNLLDPSVYQLSLSPATDINFNHSNPLKRYLINDELPQTEHQNKDSSFESNDDRERLADPQSPVEQDLLQQPLAIQVDQANGSPEEILELHQRLQSSHIPRYHGNFTTGDAFSPQSNESSLSALSVPEELHANGPTSSRSPLIPGQRPTGRRLPRIPILLSRYRSGPQSPPPKDRSLSRSKVSPIRVQGLPDAPSDFSVERTIGDHGLLVGWCPPALDDYAVNNGHSIKGYKVCINSQHEQFINSPHLTKALVDKLNLRKPQSFTIQTLAEGGVLSRAAHTIYDEARNLNASNGGAEGDGTVSSVLANVRPDGVRKVFLAVYDYSPQKHSPNANPVHEIGFKAGDIVVTRGSVQPDGFYLAKVRGKKGLVPSTFIEEVALVQSHAKRDEL